MSCWPRQPAAPTASTRPYAAGKASLGPGSPAGATNRTSAAPAPIACGPVAASSQSASVTRRGCSEPSGSAGPLAVMSTRTTMRQGPGPAWRPPLLLLLLPRPPNSAACKPRGRPSHALYAGRRDRAPVALAPGSMEPLSGLTGTMYNEAVPLSTPRTAGSLPPRAAMMCAALLPRGFQEPVPSAGEFHGRMQPPGSIPCCRTHPDMLTPARAGLRASTPEVMRHNNTRGADGGRPLSRARIAMRPQGSAPDEDVVAQTSSPASPAAPAQSAAMSRAVTATTGGAKCCPLYTFDDPDEYSGGEIGGVDQR